MFIKRLKNIAKYKYRDTKLRTKVLDFIYFLIFKPIKNIIKRFEGLHNSNNFIIPLPFCMQSNNITINENIKQNRP